MLKYRKHIPFSFNLVVVFITILFAFYSCNRDKKEFLYIDEIPNVAINENTKIDLGISIHDDNYNLLKVERFLKYISSSDRFLIVTQKEFNGTTSNEKVVLSLRYDIDQSIKSATKVAYWEHKYGIRSTFFILHTNPYYGDTRYQYFKRNNEIIYFLKKIQNSFKHEVGWHNDLVTLQLIYDIDPKIFLQSELQWLRDNGINIYGTVSHGSYYCYQYHYANHYFWENNKGSSSDFFYNWEFVPIGEKNIKIEKDRIENYNLDYNADLFKSDYFFSDVSYYKGKRWNLGMINLDTIPLGKKVIILLHPANWE